MDLLIGKLVSALKAILSNKLDAILFSNFGI
jgi:hypothetical protein